MKSDVDNADDDDDDDYNGVVVLLLLLKIMFVCLFVYDDCLLVLFFCRSNVYLYTRSDIFFTRRDNHISRSNRTVKKHKFIKMLFSFILNVFMYFNYQVNNNAYFLLLSTFSMTMLSSNTRDEWLFLWIGY